MMMMVRVLTKLVMVILVIVAEKVAAATAMEDSNYG
jgi:hypothetical protein